MFFFKKFPQELHKLQDPQKLDPARLKSEAMPWDNGRESVGRIQLLSSKDETGQQRRPERQRGGLQARVLQGDQRNAG